ncbi:efflux RND transporter permease subunit, partial [Acidisphaera rubrifaciens]|uniref:efflux RND transporter permease subunit n=1 Tax=Acidisphaera rubrifaciens TaxID=50715 RepID=UPI000662409A
MNISSTFIGRPVATTLLTIGLALAGVFAYFRLPVAPLPQVDFPTILVQATLPGASPDTVATSLAAPLERHLGQIADVTEITSQSSVSRTRITVQFGLDRDIDGAARDVEAAIQAARADLPSNLRQNPTYNKVNPADSPVMVLALTSKTMTRGQMYDKAASVLQQSLSQISGIGEVDISGSSLPAVRVELNPSALFQYGVGLEDVRAALASANANAPKGAVEIGPQRFQIYTNDQATHAADYRPLIVAYRNNAPIRLTDVGEVVDSVEDLRNLGLANGQPAVLAILYRQPGANIIETVDQVMAILPQLKAQLPGDMDVSVVLNRTTTIRGALRDTQVTLLVAIVLVVLVVFAFLRDWRATVIPSVAVPVSILGTFGMMYLFGYSLDNLSLMALIVSTGFVVDDAIVVLENIQRHVEAGMPRFAAALQGAREIGFTVISMSLSLVAVFLPILLMGGLVGRLFREFALTLTFAILVSMVVALTTTPMMCALLLRREAGRAHGRLHRASEAVFDAMLRAYERSLRWALRHTVVVMGSLFATIIGSVLLFAIVPKGFFPQQDTGVLIGYLVGDQSISFQRMEKKLRQVMAIIRADPAVESVAGFTGGRVTNTGFTFTTLKPYAERRLTADQVIGRLRPKLAHVAGATLVLQAAQDLRVGGRQAYGQYQYTLQADTDALLYEWTPKLVAALRKRPELADVNSDLQQAGLETDIDIDRATAARLNLVPSTIDATLYDAFGQRQVSTIYNALNQYHVVMEVAPRYWQSPDTLRNLWVSTSGAIASGTSTTQFPVGTATGPASTTAAAAAATPSSSINSTAAAIALNSARNAVINALAVSGNGVASAGAPVSTAKETMIPLAAFASYGPGKTPLAVNHQGQFVAATVSFNLPPGRPLSAATAAISATERAIGMPQAIHGSYAGTAATFQSSLATEPLLIAAALLAIYIVLGMLYESYIHPITILSTIPSAMVGLVLALMLFRQEFSIIALIGLILLIGIVKKNAIMMI